jgi:hypothetical protein
MASSLGHRGLSFPQVCLSTGIVFNDLVRRRTRCWRTSGY